MRAHVVAAWGVVALLAGCGGADDARTSPEPAMTTGETASTAPSAPGTEPATAPTTAPVTEPTGEDSPGAGVPDALDFTATTVGGDPFDARALAGTPVVFWFWAPWCPQCQREAPVVADLADRYEGQIEFVGVAGLTGDAASIETFVTDHGVANFPHIDDRDGAVYTRFGVTQQYDLGVVTASGDVEILRGPLSEDEIVSAVDDLAAG